MSEGKCWLSLSSLVLELGWAVRSGLPGLDLRVTPPDLCPESLGLAFVGGQAGHSDANCTAQGRCIPIKGKPQATPKEIY